MYGLIIKLLIGKSHLSNLSLTLHQPPQSKATKLHNNIN